MTDSEEVPEDWRKCSKCGKLFQEGYMVNGGFEYYCSDECLHSVYTEEEWIKMYDNGNSDSCWTYWY